MLGIYTDDDLGYLTSCRPAWLTAAGTSWSLVAADWGPVACHPAVRFDNKPLWSRHAVIG